MNLAQLKQGMRQQLRRHAMDALDERGLTQGVRVEFPTPGACVLKKFEEAQPGPGEILVESIRTAISPGTERAIFQKRENVLADYPYVPGYSHVGRVIRAGAGSRIQEGQMVTTGGPHASLYLCSAEKAFVVPPDVPLDHAVFTQIGFISLQGVRKAALQPGERVLVLGCGLIGQLALQFAQLAGVEVIAAATSNERLAVASQCGAERTINVRETPDALEQLQADVVIDTTGNPASFNGALHAVACNGRIILLGSNRGISPAVELEVWEARQAKVIGAHVFSVPLSEPSPHYWTWRRESETFLAFLAQQQLMIDPLITRRVSPAQAPQVYQELASDQDKSIAVLFDWSMPGDWHNHIEYASPLRGIRKKVQQVFRRTSPVASVFLLPRADGKKLRFGLIGCGEIAVENAQAIRAASNATITFAADLNLDLARGLAAATNAQATTNVEELLASPQVDAVLISTPHHLHAPLAVGAAEAGKHVVVEKPMATTVAEADQMIAAAARHGVQLSVCYCQRFTPNVQKAKELLEKGVVGDVLSTRITFGQYRGADYWRGGMTGRVYSDWRTRRETAGGGVLVMNACHLLDYMCWLVNSPVIEVSSCLATLTHPTEVEDTISLSYRYRNGAIGTLEATNAQTGPGTFEQIIRGREGQLIVAPSLRFWSRKTIDGYEAGRWYTVKSLPKAAERRHFFETFADAIFNGNEPPVTAQQARAVQLAMALSYQSNDWHIGRGSSVETNTYLGGSR